MRVCVCMHVHDCVTGGLGGDRVHAEAEALQAAVSANPGAALHAPGSSAGSAHQLPTSLQAKHDADK